MWIRPHRPYRQRRRYLTPTAWELSNDLEIFGFLTVVYLVGVPYSLPKSNVNELVRGVLFLNRVENFFVMFRSLAQIFKFWQYLGICVPISGEECNWPRFRQKFQEFQPLFQAQLIFQKEFWSTAYAILRGSGQPHFQLPESSRKEFCQIKNCGWKTFLILKNRSLLDIFEKKE